MGASSWHYVTEHTENPNEALQRLREQVFESGQYADPFSRGDVWTLFRQMPFAVKLIVLAAKGFHSAASFARWVLRGFRGPRSIDEAVAIAAESGTHSILDIERCSQTPDFGVAWLLSPARRKRLFGTEEPTADDLERVGWTTPAEDLERWQAVYFPLYDGGQPIKLVFVGCSGD